MFPDLGPWALFKNTLFLTWAPGTGPGTGALFKNTLSQMGLGPGPGPGPKWALDRARALGPNGPWAQIGPGPKWALGPHVILYNKKINILLGQISYTKS